jgi:hypothetical protein
MTAASPGIQFLPHRLFFVHMLITSMDDLFHEYCSTTLKRWNLNLIQGIDFNDWYRQAAGLVCGELKLGGCNFHLGVL